VHSPAGGLGLNAGLQDAANLGWKLAAEAQRRAPAGLLDSYHAARHPVGRSTVRASATMLRLALARSPVVRAARWPVAGAVTRIPALNRRVTGFVSGIAIRYPDGVPGGWADRVDHAAAGGERLLVRPDGYVAWSAGDGDLRAALARWCGPPA
jgi:FAD binding domain-containing protein/aromatic ring hydroxylase-like protein